MRADKTLLEMYENGQQHDMTDEERAHLRTLPEYAAQVEAARVPTASIVAEEELDKVRARVPQPQPPAADPWDKRRYHLQGEAGELYRYFLEASGCNQPKFAEAATLTLLGALLGRGVKNATGLRTNIYTLAVGFTSAGKDDFIGLIQKVTKALGRDKRLLAGAMTSEAALEKTLDAFPVRLLLLDEVGHFFGTLKRGAGGSNGYLMTVIPALTKLWSAANRDHQLATRATPQDDTRKWRPPTVLHEPCLCVYGTSAPQPLFANLQESDLMDGSLPRYIPFISKTREEYRARAEKPIPPELIEKIDRRLLVLGLSRAMYRGDDEKAELPSEVRTIQHTPEAAAIMAEFEEIKTDRLRQADNGDPFLYLWGKVRENAERIALAIACFNGSDSPAIDEYAAGYASELMLLTICDMIRDARLNIGRDKTEREVEKILDAIRRAGRNGITGSELGKKTQTIKPRDRRDYLDDLADSGRITCVMKTSGGTKPTRTYFYTDQEGENQ